MATGPKYSVIIPVFDRPQEVEELLESLARQTCKNFEVILVDDGSTRTSDRVYEKYSTQLTIRYFFKPNSGPGPSRNYGFERASGEYFVVFDSDCILPPHYFDAVEQFLAIKPLDAWGGPDRGSEMFTTSQRAMAYTMSSLLTTGGIRGASAKGFQPRSFNMGISRPAYDATKGFRFDRLAEDIELSIRLKKAGFRIGLIPDAFVYHKRRTNFSQFYRQVSNFGMGRVMVGRVHAGAVKPSHWFPTFFLAGLVAIPFLWLLFTPVARFLVAGYAIYLAAIFVDALIKTRSLPVAVLSVPSAVVQLTGYGSGFLKAMMTAPRPRSKG